MEQQITVDFISTDGGTYPMTWGQRAIWKPIRAYGDASWYFNIPLVVDLPSDPAPEQGAVIAAVRRLVERNQALRAHFTDAPGGPVQQIERSGTFGIRLVHAAARDSRAHAEGLAAELAATSFRHDKEWPVRIALVCAGGLPRHAVLVVSHITADGGGCGALIKDLLALLRAPSDGGGTGAPAARWQPADQVLREQSKRGARRNRAAVEYWRRHLERIPPSMFGSPPVPAAEPRFQQLRLSSRALAIAAARLAADCQVSVPSVVLTGTALALAALGGRATSALQLISGNRLDPAIRGLVAPTAQNGLLVVDFPAGTVAEAVRATHKAATAAYFYGYYDPAAIDGLLSEVSIARGVEFDLTAYFNDVSAFLDEADGLDLRQAADARLPEEEASRLLARSEITVTGAWDTQDSKFFLRAALGDTFRLFLLADTAYLPLPAMEAVLRGIETIVFQAAYRKLAIADIPAVTGLVPPAS
jgi:Condensation domain